VWVALRSISAQIVILGQQGMNNSHSMLSDTVSSCSTADTNLAESLRLACERVDDGCQVQLTRFLCRATDQALALQAAKHLTDLLSSKRPKPVGKQIQDSTEAESVSAVAQRPRQVVSGSNDHTQQQRIVPPAVWVRLRGVC
jgi:hypothetical protein